MKIIKSLFLLALAFTVLSCSEDEKPSFDETLLPGEWELSTLDYSGTTTTSYSVLSIEADFVGTLVESDLLVNFTAEPNEFVSSGSYLIELETTVAGQSTTTTQEFPNILLPGTWRIEHDKLIVENEIAGEQETTIKRLDDSSLIITVKLTETYSQSGAEITTVVNGVYSLTRMQ